MPSARFAVSHELRFGEPRFEQWVATVAGEDRAMEPLLITLRGPAGAGLHGAARDLAARLGRPLLRVDLSGIVSPYIGETEKNLEHALARARASGAILLFDEADALFGQRSAGSGAREAHDRYANQEVSYLLSRLQTHRGIAIVCAHSRHAVAAPRASRLRQVELRWPPR